MIKSITIEICCGSYDDCLVALDNQADRIELNSSLELGGMTPSLATLLAVKAISAIPLCCMVRPRPAGFVYSESLFEIALSDARLFLENGADGIVFGFLLADNTIDGKRTKQMTDLIHDFGKEAVFHKAFDQCPDLDIASQELIACSVDRVLTSGGYPPSKILEGAQRLHSLNANYGASLSYLPGGGVSSDNIRQILDISNCKEIHMTGKALHFDSSEYVAVDATNLKKILANI